MTWAILGLVAVIIAVYDVWIIKKKGKQASISADIIRMSKKLPAIVFLIGLLLGFIFGHLFWSMDTFDWMPVDKIIERCREYTEKA